jgi:hypothetical protein
LGRSYAKLLEYIKQKGYEVVMPTREVYVKGPGITAVNMNSKCNSLHIIQLGKSPIQLQGDRHEHAPLELERDGLW